ncbi:MAG: type II toxin-antitoxin system VapC family toxin [Bacillota bacterium]
MTSERAGKEYFIDTSALLKAYIAEKGTDALDRIFEEKARRSISNMGLLEAVSVFQRLHSVEKLLSRDQFEALCAELLADVASGRLVALSVTPRDVQEALVLEIQQYLTAVDAVQIALAMEMGENVVFVSSDEKLNRVARENGLRVLTP